MRMRVPLMRPRRLRIGNLPIILRHIAEGDVT